MKNKSKHLTQFPVTLEQTARILQIVIIPPPPDTNTGNLLVFTTNTTPTKQSNAEKNVEIILSKVPMDSLECTNITTKDNTHANTKSNKANIITQETSTDKEFMMIEMSHMSKRQTESSERFIQSPSKQKINSK